MNLLITIAVICFFAFIEVKGGKHGKGGFGGIGKALGGAGKTFNHATRDVGRAANHAGGALNHISHQTARTTKRTANQAVNFAGHNTNQAIHSTERTANQAANFAGRASNQEINRIERTVNHATPYVQRTAYKTGDEIRHAAYVTGDGIKDTANEIGNFLEFIDLHDHSHDHRYCHHCRCYRGGCRCNHSSYGYNSHNRRYNHNDYYFWPYQSSQPRSRYNYNTPSADPYTHPNSSPNRDDEFNELYSHALNEKIGCARPTCNERFFGTGNWISGSKLEKKITDAGAIQEAEYIDKCFYFENKFELLIAVRESLINHRTRTLNKLITNYKEFIPEFSTALIAWFFHELYLPFGESARQMASSMFELELDVNVPYNGKTALQYALENFNVEAFEWIYEHGGRFDHFRNGDSFQVRSDVPISTTDIIKLSKSFEKLNVNHMITYNEGSRQFDLTFATKEATAI